MQRDLCIGAVKGFAARVRLDIDRVARRHERRDIGDCVVNAITGGVALDKHRLVQIHGSDGVNRDQRNVGAVKLRQARRGTRARGRGPNLRRKRERQSLPALYVADALRAA